PVEILGLTSVPEAGEMFYAVEDERQARDIAFKRQQQLKEEKLNANQKITLEDLYTQLEEGAVKELNVILKADVQGSLEALIDSLQKIPSNKVKIKFIHTGVGDVNASDVLLADASQAIIIAFHVGIGPRAKQELEQKPVEIREYRIIYDAVNDMRNALEGMLEKKIHKNFQARIEVKQVFKTTKSGIVAGCIVSKGKVKRKAHIDIMRNGEIIHSGTLHSLKRFKDDVKEVTEGMECGVSLDNFTDFQEGDTIEVYEVESVAQKL
ncbi:MAG: translation initiation factor IF-2, partial [Candidatus Omnitrophica bacterium]|nr:translation initiation factor IF-2 [Candidatus Omnitrophota bacterium]